MLAPTEQATADAPGLATLTCARLLRARGWQVAVGAKPAASGGAILLRPATARLLCTLWGDTDGGLLEAAHRLRFRRLRWGGGAETVVEQPGYVIALGPLLAALAGQLGEDTGFDGGQPHWTLASREATAARLGSMQRVGTRHAWVTEAQLAADAPDDEAVLEQHGGGWFMLLPCGKGRAVLHSVALGAPLSNLPPVPPAWISQHIGGLGAPTGPFPAMPRLRVPAARPALLALGEAALGLDPLCGDGAGHALRGAWAAAEALTAGQAGSLQDYQNGLAFAFDRHCRACAEHYAACGPEWAADAGNRFN